MLRNLGESSAYIGTNGFGKNDDEPIYFGNTTPDVVTYIIKSENYAMKILKILLLKHHLMQWR